MTEHAMNRGAAEDGAGSPLTPAEVEASIRPPSAGEPPDPEDANEDEDGRGQTA